jgi:hypothetical protein
MVSRNRHVQVAEYWNNIFLEKYFSPSSYPVFNAVGPVAQCLPNCGPRAAVGLQKIFTYSISIGENINFIVRLTLKYVQFS